MTDTEYLTAAETLLQRIELSADRINDETDTDIDVQRSGGMVTLVFANRTQIVVNMQKPLREVWMASKAAGYHYTQRNGQWLATKDATEFWADLNRDATRQAGQPLSF